MISSKCKGDFFPTKHLEALDAQTCLQAQLGEFARADETSEKIGRGKVSSCPNLLAGLVAGLYECDRSQARGRA